jgi:hypothetical protein
MASTAAHLVDRVLPRAPYRQWVLSLPHRVRFLVARDATLLGEVVGIFLRKLFAWQRRRARAHDLPVSHPGAVTFVQRFGSLLNLNCHAHAVLPDGVFAVGPEGAVAFRALPPPWDDDVVRLLAQIARAVEARIARRLADRSDDDAPDRFAQDQAAAVRSPPSPSPTAVPTAAGRRVAFLDGYSLHADRLLDADDRDGLERLCRYGARSPVANHRLSRGAAGQVVMALRIRPLMAASTTRGSRCRSGA